MVVKPPFFQVLSGEEVESVHETSLRILSEIGLKFIDEAALRTLDEGGAEVDFNTQIVKMPPGLVEEMVRKAPRRFILHALNPRGDLNIGGYQTYFGTGNALNILEGKESRRILKEDLAKYIRLADALEHVDFCVGTGVADAPPKTWDIHQFEVMVNNSSKHLRPVIATPRGADTILKMAEVVAGGGEALAKRPIISVGYVASAPLRWDRTALYVFRRTAEYNLPVNVESEPLTGGTSPVTLAGSIALANAEVLGGVVYNQLLREGRPCFYSIGFTHTFDLRTALPLSGSPEAMLIAAAGAQLARRYGLPSLSWVSSDSKIVDGQSILEKTMSIAVHMLAGNTLIWGLGNMESQASMSLEQTIIDEEAVRLVKRLQEGVEVNVETLALETVRRVGVGGNFLAEKHTSTHYLREHVQATVLDRSTREAWLKKGSTTLMERVKAKLHRLLESHEPTPLDEDVRRTIREIVVEADRTSAAAYRE